MRDRLFSVLLTMGALRMGRTFYWWLALTQYMRHMGRCFKYIADKVRQYAQWLARSTMRQMGRCFMHIENKVKQYVR